MTDLGKLLLSVEPDATGFGKKLAGLLGGEEVVGALGGAGKMAALTFAGAFSAGLAVVGILEHIGNQFSTAESTIRVGTGKTGKALDSLNTSFMNVFRQVPAGAAAVASTVTTINQKLGESGKPLEQLTTQLLDLSHITKTDVGANVAAVTSLFNNWSVSGKNAGSTLDMLFRASQKSGVGVGDLASQLTTGGVRLREIGLSLQDSTALLALLGKQGLSVSTIIPGISAALKDAAKAGIPAQQFWRDTFAIIKNAPNDTVAAGEALKVFGARAGPQLAGLIREGKLSYEDFAKTLGKGDSIVGATKATETWRDKLDKLRNLLEEKLAPAGKAVFADIGKAIDLVTKDINVGFGPGGVGTKAIDWVSSHWHDFGAIFDQVVGGAKKGIGDLATAFGTNKKTIIEVIAGVTLGLIGLALAWNLGPGIIVTGVVLLAGALLYAYGHFTWFRDGVKKVCEDVGNAWKKIEPTVKAALDLVGLIVTKAVAIIEDIWVRFGSHLVTHLTTAWHAIYQVVSGALEVVRGVIEVVTGIITGHWSKVWGGLGLIVGGAWNVVIGIAKYGINLLSTAIGLGMAVLTDAWGGIWSGLESVAAGIWGGIERAAATGVNVVIGIINGFIRVYNDTIGKLPSFMGGGHISPLGPVSWGSSAPLQGPVRVAPGAPGQTISGHAFGGIAPANQWGLVGEYGAELIQPATAMRITPTEVSRDIIRSGADLARAGTQRPPIVFTGNIQSWDDRDLARRLLEQARRAEILSGFV